ncbi:short-chain dehydrogenase [Tumebacillus algifaecis]|uniref:Short-chain dehydrogenase n=1 Tax=Tumebacillus algifaecis TaxID=1214604 RepID=A0A223CXH8_9BACL|nr:SDR family oxidoreductase [Tumebacillus algifaecis]ASS73894.1 short-chain dehydrogenase [Tumebacillus algifaecis]
MKNVLILGATSGIAKALAYQFAGKKHNLLLAGRDVEEMKRIAQDIHIRHGVKVTVHPFDALDYDGHADFFTNCLETAGEIDGIVLAYGYLGDQRRAENEFAEARRVIETNYLSAVSVLNIAANYFESKKDGFLCVLSSVAGDRGRQSNFMYGSAKGGLSLYLQGLRNRLSKSGVHVLTVKPGFVDTKMTFGQSGMFLVAKPEQVAKAIDKMIQKRVDVAYTPFFWRYIMLIIKSVPERIFKRLSL